MVPPIALADADAAGGGIRDRMGEVWRCYGKAVMTAPALQGSLELALNVTPEGEVTEVALSGPPSREPFFSACVERRALQWRFPVRTGPEETLDTEVLYRVLLVPKKPRKRPEG